MDRNILEANPHQVIRGDDNLRFMPWELPGGISSIRAEYPQAIMQVKRLFSRPGKKGLLGTGYGGEFDFDLEVFEGSGLLSVERRQR